MSAHTYRFFDVAIELLLPAPLMEQWDALYGVFRGGPDGAFGKLDISWTPAERGSGLLRIAGLERVIAADKVMIVLQSVVQNTVLASVQSLLLWHGAVWEMDGRGVVILGESGLGKTTLSLAWALKGGRVLSDEVAAWCPLTQRLAAFPRPLAARLETLSLLKTPDTYRHLPLEEEKAIIPLTASADRRAPLRAVVFLEWARDAATENNVCELCVHAPDDSWRDRLVARQEVLRVEPHPDGNGWWRCSSREPLKSAAIEQVLGASGAVLTGFHRGARRMPAFKGDAELEPADDGSVERAMAFLINGRAVAASHTPSGLMTMSRAALHTARCAVCRPGEVAGTLRAIEQFVSAPDELNAHAASWPAAPACRTSPSGEG